MSVMVWNVSGLKSPGRVDFLTRHLAADPARDAVVGLVETRWRKECKVRLRGYKNVVSAAAEGLSGGLVLFVRKDVKCVAAGGVNRRCIWCDVVVEGTLVRVVLIYGSQHKHENERLRKDV